MSNFKWMPILKTGTFTAKNKKQVTFDEAKLDQIIANTDLSKEPQFVVEHPNYDKLGFGTISELKRVGSYLFALPKKVEEKFKAVVNSGELPGRSISIDENTLALNHIGFLPKEIAPAVDGLGSYSFSSDSSDSRLQFSLPELESHFAEIKDDKYEFEKYEVSQWPFKTIKNIFRNIKNAWIEKYGKEEADEIFNEWEIEEAGTPPRIYEEEKTSMFSTNQTEDKMDINLSGIDLSKVDPKLKAAFEALQSENTSIKTELQTAKITLSASEMAAQKKEILAFCESEEMKLKILPAEKDKIVNLLLSVKEKGNLEFSSSDNTPVKFDAYEFLKETLKQIPNKIELSEIATSQTAGDQQMAEYQKVGKELASFVK
ncbi:MAG: hypothetical protein KF816_11440 [Melioribacteraceae bacterium]|nr:hypothetical protein [Melioribacteraceae bacterium]